VDDDGTARARVQVPSGVRLITGAGGADELARHLLATDRRWPVVVATTAHGFDAPHIDVAAVAEDLRGLAEVVAVTSQDATWHLSDLLPPNSQVYGGATRVYPVDPSWQTLTRRAPMTLTRSAADSPQSVERVVSDAMSAALAAGLLDRPPAPTSEVVTARVAGLLPERALLTLPSGTLTTLREELTGYGIPVERLVRVGQEVAGRHDVESGRFDLEPRPGATKLPSTYTTGATVLARVVAVHRDGLTAELAPGVEVEVPRDAVTGNSLDDVDALFVAGETVAVRLTSEEPLALSFLEVDDDDVPLDAPAVLPGGPPWLVPPPAWSAPVFRRAPETAVPTAPSAHSTTSDSPAPAAPPDAPPTPAASAGAPSGPLPGPHLVHAASQPRPAGDPGPTTGSIPTAGTGKALRDAQLALAAARAEIERLRGIERELVLVRRDLDRAIAEIRDLTRTVTAQRERYRSLDRTRQQLEKRLRASSTPSDVELDSRRHFTSVEDALRHDVHTAWVRTVPATEKDARPLPAWSIGEAFVGSLDHLGDVSWAKLCAVVLDVVLQDPDRLAQREDHPLRDGSGGTAPPRTRADGATARRIYLQQRSASARRLHYWRLRETIELSRVVLHDDFAP